MAFGLGRLEPALAEDIESHLENCQSCCDTLLNLGDDTFAGLVRKSSAAAATAQTIAVPGTVGDNVDGAGLPRELREHARYEIVRLLGRGGMAIPAEHFRMIREIPGNPSMRRVCPVLLAMMLIGCDEAPSGSALQSAATSGVASSVPSPAAAPLGLDTPQQVMEKAEFARHNLDWATFVSYLTPETHDRLVLQELHMNSVAS